MADISKEELKKEIQEILKDADLDNTSAKKVRLQLQEKLDCDLTERKKEVDALVMEVIDEQTQDEEGEDEDDEEDEDEEEEEEEEKPRKKPAPKKRAGSGSGSEDEEPSDGGGSDYEPDEPVKIKKSPKKAVKRKNKFGSDDESSGEEWGGSKGKKKKPATKKKKKKADSDGESDDEKPKPPKKKRAASGYTAPVKLSTELADIVGGTEMPRHEVVKRMWQYIKDNNLQDPKNRQMIKCDEKLSKIVPTKKFRGFGMAKFLKSHMSVNNE